MRIVFAGTPQFAAAALGALLACRADVVGVLTQPDRPSGRGRKVRPGPVKALALEHGLTVDQPASLRAPEARDRLRALAPELLVVVAYGLLLPRAVLAIPPRGAINVHASRLPRWRGAAPIQHALLAGDAVSGISVMRLDEGLDTGPLLAQRSCPIPPDETAARLHDRLAALGAETLLEVVDAMREGPVVETPQPVTGANYAPRISKSEACVDWRRPASEIDRIIRAFNPWPVAFSHLGSTVVRLWAAVPLPGHRVRTPGSILACSRDGIDVACGEGILRVQRLQMPGARVLAAAEWLNAHRPPAGTAFGPQPQRGPVAR